MLAVIFDMDGVLLDSYRPHFESWMRTATRRGVPFTEDDFRRTFGQTNRHIIPLLYGDRFSAAEVAAFGEEKEQVYRDIISRDFPAMDGAADLIIALHAAGIPMAIGSSGPRENVVSAMRGLPHSDLIATFVSGCDVKHGKPDPEVFTLCAQRLAVSPRDCAVVEDSLMGLEAARAAGMTAIALTGTTPREKLAELAHVVVESLREITPAKVKEWVWRRAGA